jgi:hypothetical protein
MQTSEFMSREFAADRIASLRVRSVSAAFAKAQLAGDLLAGMVLRSSERKIGNITTIRQTVRSSQQLSLRAGDKLALLADERIVYRIEDLEPDSTPGEVLVHVEVLNGKRSPNLPGIGTSVVLAPPVRDRAALIRSRIIAWDRMRALPPAVAAPVSVQITQDLAKAVAALRGKL